jgi:hypothetical protein
MENKNLEKFNVEGWENIPDDIMVESDFADFMLKDARRQVKETVAQVETDIAKGVYDPNKVYEATHGIFKHVDKQKVADVVIESDKK